MVGDGQRGGDGRAAPWPTRPRNRWRVLAATPLGIGLGLTSGGAARAFLARTGAAGHVPPAAGWRCAAAPRWQLAPCRTCRRNRGAVGLLHRLADVDPPARCGNLAGRRLPCCLPARSAAVRNRTHSRRNLPGFACAGTLVVAALVLTGAVNCLAIIGWPLPPAFWTSLWGTVLAAKLALFAAMLAPCGAQSLAADPALAAGQAGADESTAALADV